ncbi:MAG TPA: DUF1015 domain-containing protein [Streptosporangiaceae bacterium]
MQILPSDPRTGVALAPFRGIRYARNRVSGIANVISPPYDVISGGNLEQLRAADPHNVVRLILPGEGAEAPAVAACLLREWLSDGVLIQDRIPHLYLYEQAAAPADAEAWRQRGIIGLVRLGSPDTAGILPHENVMPGPVANRRQLMAATRANLEPIFLVYDGEERMGEDGVTLTATEVIDHVADERTPLLRIDTEDWVTHQLWRLDDPAECEAIIADLATRRALIADGHHRYAAYLGLQEEIRATGAGEGPWDYGLALLVDSVACPPSLGAIHRVLPGMAPDRAAELAKAAFTVETLPAGTGLAQARARLAGAGREGTAFLLAGQCGYRLLSNPDPVQVAASMPPETSASWQALDASVLQQLLLGLWGITDNERDVLIYHDAADAAGAVGAGDVAAAADAADPAAAAGARGTAVILNPVPFEAVRKIAEHGERVPRKSTSFGPKPRTGLVLRTFGPREPRPGDP